MPRFLRGFLLGCIAFAFAYVLLHAREPLRLGAGDPSSDATVLSSIEDVKRHGLAEHLFADAVDAGPQIIDAHRRNHAPPLVEIIYGVAGTYLGAGDIGALRLFALACSALALWLLFQYARRIWSGPVALLGTALFSTSLSWMTYADSLYQVPIMQASGFLALWGLVRAIETRQRRHYAAAFLGAWACYLASYEYWLVLPAAMLFTVHRKLGNPLARGHRHFVVICAAGCVAGVVTNALFVAGAGGWQELVGDPLARAFLDRKLGSPLSTLIRRYTFVFTPMFWITLGSTTWRALRAPSLGSVLADGVTWMLVVAAVMLGACWQLAASQMFGSQPVLLFYAIGSAVLIHRLLEGPSLRRALAIAWLAAAPVWSCYFMLTHPRSTLDRDDVAKVNAYLAASDRNDFVLSNLLSDGPIQAAFDRHTLAAPAGHDTAQAYLEMLNVLEAAGTNYVHAVIFTTPDSRFTDKPLWLLAMPRQLWSVTGWPQLNRSRAISLIAEYDRNVAKNLARVDAKQVLHLRNFDVYRIDRASVLEAAGRSIPVVREIDFSSIGSNKHKLLGWSEPRFTKEARIGVSSINGYAPCANSAANLVASSVSSSVASSVSSSVSSSVASSLIEHRAGEPGRNACETVLTRSGLKMLDEGWADRAQLMIRVARACDLRLTLEFASPALLELSINDFTTAQCVSAKHLSVLIPERSVRAGINVISLEKLPGPADLRTDVLSLVIDPVCGP